MRDPPLQFNRINHPSSFKTVYYEDNKLYKYITASRVHKYWIEKDCVNTETIQYLDLEAKNVIRSGTITQQYIFLDCTVFLIR